MEVKKGTKTSEFWVVILGGLLGQGGLLVYLAEKLPTDSLIYAVVTASISAGGIIWKYINSRTKVKVAVSEAEKK